MWSNNVDRDQHVTAILNRGHQSCGKEECPVFFYSRRRKSFCSLRSSPPLKFALNFTLNKEKSLRWNKLTSLLQRVPARRRCWDRQRSEWQSWSCSTSRCFQLSCLTAVRRPDPPLSCCSRTRHFGKPENINVAAECGGAPSRTRNRAHGSAADPPLSGQVT